MSQRRGLRAVATALMVLILAGCGSSDPAAYIASARKYLARSEYNAAIIELKNALKLAPNDASARFLLARALLESGNAVGAEVEARKALELGYPADDAVPVLARAYLLQSEYRKLITQSDGWQVQQPEARAEVDAMRGLAFLALGDRTAARVALDAALAGNPKSIQTRIAQARLAAVEYRTATALALLDAVLADAPVEIEALALKSDLLFTAGRADEAIRMLEQAVGNKPDSAPLRWALIFALVRADKASAAASHVQEVRRIAPGNPRTWYTEALLAYAQGQLPAARAAVERARHFDPDYVPALYLSGLIHLRAEAYGPAEAALRSVVAKLPDDEGARRALATAYMRRGKAARALETLEPLLKRSPDDPSLLRAIAEVHFAANNPAKAAELFARANKLDSGNVTGRIRLAQMRLAMGDTARAFRDLEILAASESTSVDPDLALISAHLQRREFDQALAAVASLERKQPTSPVTHNVKGVVYMSRGDHRNARAGFEKALSFDPDYATAAYNLARLDFLERDYDGARKRYDQVLARDPQNEPALLGLAELLAETKAPPAAVRAAVERAIVANPLSARPRLLLIGYNGRQGDWKAAVAAALKAESEMPDNAQIVEALGMARYAAGELNQAIASLKRAAQLEPDNPVPLLRLAEIQGRTKDYDGSIESLRIALDTQPDSADAATALAGIYTDAGRIESGIDHARRLQKQRPERAVGFALEGDLHARQSKWPEAVTSYRAALARQPSPFVVSRLYKALEGARRPDEANAVAQRWIVDQPTDVLVRAFLAEQSMARNEHRAAVAQLRAAVDIEPDNAVLLNNLAWSLGELGDPQAIEYAARAYALAPGNAEMADTYGWVLVRLGDNARGIELLRRSLELAPGDTGKRIRLARGLLKAGEKAAARKELETLITAETPVQVRAEAENLLKGL